MTTQTAEVMQEIEIQALLRKISALPNKSFLKLADYVEDLIEELEEEEDIAFIDSLAPEDYANAIPEDEVIAEIEARYGPLD